MARREAKASTKIFPPMIWTKKPYSGFSLIEMLVVMAIIALIAATALPTVSSYFQVSIQSATREIASTVKESYYAAVLSGKVHRLAYDLENQTFWTESSKRFVLIHTAKTLENDKRQHRFDGKKPAPEDGFSLEVQVTKNKKALPRGVLFEDIFNEQSPENIEKGIVYTHIFPNGFTEQTLIHLKDSSNHQVSLVITPLLGMTDFYPMYHKASDVFQKKP
jgi:prepilin-type N-terminal cleavage/methylation domain-containing protein